MENLVREIYGKPSEDLLVICIRDVCHPVCSRVHESTREFRGNISAEVASLINSEAGTR